MWNRLRRPEVGERKSLQRPRPTPIGLDVLELRQHLDAAVAVEDLAEKLGPEYACGFAYGLKRGLILAHLRPEWARGLYHLIRSHYLEIHTEEDPLDWEDHADQTVRAIPIEIKDQGIKP